jgi:hypothetical protein
VRLPDGSPAPRGESVLHEVVVAQSPERPSGDVAARASWDRGGVVVLQGPRAAYTQGLVVATDGWPVVFRWAPSGGELVPDGRVDVPVGAVLVGTVVDRAGRPVPDLSIVISSLGHRAAVFCNDETDLGVAVAGRGVPDAWTRVRTDAAGRFTAHVTPDVPLRAVADSDAWVLFDVDAWKTAVVQVPDTGATVRWMAAPARVLVATVTDATDGDVPAQAMLELGMDATFSTTVRIKDGPRFSWPDRSLPERTDEITVKAGAPGYVAERRVLRYEPGSAVVRADFRLVPIESLPEPVVLTLDVVDGSGRPVDLSWQVGLAGSTDPGGRPALRPAARRDGPGRLLVDVPPIDWTLVLDLEQPLRDLYEWRGPVHLASTARTARAVVPEPGLLVVEWRASGDAPAVEGAGLWIRRPGAGWWSGYGDVSLPLRIHLPPMTLPLRFERGSGHVREGSATIRPGVETDVDVSTWAEVPASR